MCSKSDCDNVLFLVYAAEQGKVTTLEDEILKLKEIKLHLNIELID